MTLYVWCPDYLNVCFCVTLLPWLPFSMMITRIWLFPRLSYYSFTKTNSLIVQYAIRFVVFSSCYSGDLVAQKPQHKPKDLIVKCRFVTHLKLYISNTFLSWIAEVIKLHMGGFKGGGHHAPAPPWISEGGAREGPPFGYTIAKIA